MALSWCPTRRLAYVSVDDQEILLDYSIFENIERGLVTPSMYSWMTAWLQKTLSSRRIQDVMTDSLTRRIQIDAWAEDAHRAYHDLPWQERLANHKDTIDDLVEERDNFEKAEREIRQTDNPFDPSSPVYAAYNAWANTKIAEYSWVAMQISDELDEEEQWEQGGEDGASQTDGPRYDEMDEP
jgi:hypothetical protein